MVSLSNHVMKFPFVLYKVEGTSMLPTLKPGQRILVYRWGKAKVGDLIVFKKEAKTMVKRVVRVEGEQRYVKGDNERASSYSREWGSIEEKEVMGVVCAKG